MAKRIKRMSVNDYKELFEEVVKMTNDADGFGLFDQISEEDVEKAKWIAFIIDCLNDVPLTRVEHIFEQKNIEFDVEEFYEENGWYVTSVCPQCGAIQYDGKWHYNEKREPFAFISQKALDNMHDLNISYERFLRYSADYVISRRLYDFLTERYPRTHYFPLFLKQETED